MISNMDAGSPDRARDERAWCGSGRSSGIFCGLMMLIIGIIWIGKQAGFIPLDMELFWPAVMVIAGAWILAGAIVKRRRIS